MINVKELKEKYINKNWYNSNNEIITLKDIVEFKGIGLYKIAFQKGFHEPIKYLHDISEIELIDFLCELKIKKNMPEIETKPIKKQSDLETLKDILFVTINDVIEESINCSKANTISKVAQTILNLEKLQIQKKTIIK
jgi:hypothetical protein